MALDLPREIFIQEITTRLPIESLVRLRSVCKLWNSLFFDSVVFIQSNKKPSVSQNPSNEYLILYTVKDFISLSILSRNNLSESRIDNVPCPIYRRFNFNLLGSINGLVCMFSTQQHAQNFVLWNPVIHLSKKILLPQRLDAYLLGFGWDSVEDDYRLIASSATRVSVYSFKTGCWSTKNLLPDHLSITYWHSSFTSVIVKGNPYWCQRNFVAKFDVRIGNFKSLKLPEHKHRFCNLINMNNCLGWIDHRSDGVMDVYLFNEECCLWRKMYSFSFAGNYGYPMFPMCFMYGGEIVLNGKYSLYDPKSSEIKTFGCEDNGGCVGGCSYTPSLLVLEGMKPFGLISGSQETTT